MKFSNNYSLTTDRIVSALILTAIPVSVKPLLLTDDSILLN